MHLPIFDAGKIRAQYAGATAELDVAVADYNGAVLNAVKQTADAMTEVKSLAAQRAPAGDAVDSASRAYEIARERYRRRPVRPDSDADRGSTLLRRASRWRRWSPMAAKQRITLLLSVGGGFNPKRPTDSDSQDCQAGRFAMSDTAQAQPNRSRRFWFLILGVVVLIARHRLWRLLVARRPLLREHRRRLCRAAMWWPSPAAKTPR